MIFQITNPIIMNKIILTALVVLSFSLAACTRDSSKTTENKNTTDSPDKKQEQTSKIQIQILLIKNLRRPVRQQIRRAQE
jgi:hypothetical protein